MGCLKLTYRQEPDFRVIYSKNELTLQNTSKKAYRDYLYGFGGHEKDDEVKGSGNSYTTFFRQNDPRLGRWLTIDPKATAFESPYVSMGNNPIWHNDVLGDKWGKPGDKNKSERLIKKLNTKIENAEFQYENEREKITKTALRIDAGEVGLEEQYDTQFQKMEETSDKIVSLLGTKKHLEIMGDESNPQIFTFETSEIKNQGYTKVENNIIVMHIATGNNTDGNTVHEISHAYDIFQSNNIIHNNSFNEIKAYKNQYFFSIGERDENGKPIDFNQVVPSTTVISNSRDINKKWLFGIKDTQGNQVYFYPNE